KNRVRALPELPPLHPEPLGHGLVSVCSSQGRSAAPGSRVEAQGLYSRGTAARRSAPKRGLDAGAGRVLNDVLAMPLGVKREGTDRRTNPMTMIAWFDDLAVGMQFKSGEARITAPEIKRFAAEFDPQPMHLDEEATGKAFFKGLAASGWHTASIAMR